LIFAGLVTVFIIGAMALDRFMALKHPYIYHANVKYKQATYIILTLWVVAIVIALLPIIGLGENMKNLSMLKIYQCKLTLDLPLKGHSTQ
jgi:prostaglandin E receptor 4